MLTKVRSQAEFYREFLMGRPAYTPQDYGIEMERENFDDLMVEELNVQFRGAMTIDELVLRPRQAIKFCDDVRHKHHFFDLPDDIILRAIMIRRKKG